ncbi:guanine nucleotide binding protein (G protein) alpha v1 isoform X1 [Clupea harengus]|uniref:Guanine nucleotide binding protein (G protein) alpha v1 isoform X1 n=1 Tax=Clupea harengus TaxID=7950 RepID=A0A6P8FA10_CLUHA|nr:guanine nucleotide binding protein (G protein) alpha v1 isoform X1 [Clupea harengus]
MFGCLDLAGSSVQTCWHALRLCFRREVTEEEKVARSTSARIDRDLFEHAKLESHVVKILLLGAAESGKSTVVKQIKIIHSHGFSRRELISFKPAVLDNLLNSMKFVLWGMGLLRINLANQRNKDHAQSVLACDWCTGKDAELLPFLAQAFCCLWADQGVRAAAARGYEYQLNDSALYFFDNIGRIIGPNYVPTETDVLRVRVRTSGVTETQFCAAQFIFRLYDVGGQCTQKRKWLRCFDGVRAVLFLVDLSRYDLRPQQQDSSTGCIQDSLELYSSILSNTVFSSASLILIMNKMDLFQEKILNSGRHLRIYVPDFKGADRDVSGAAGFLTSLFTEHLTSPAKPLYHHYSTATDTSCIRDIFQTVMDNVVKDNLANVCTL